MLTQRQSNITKQPLDSHPTHAYTTLIKHNAKRIMSKQSLDVPLNYLKLFSNVGPNITTYRLNNKLIININTFNFQLLQHVSRGTATTQSAVPDIHIHHPKLSHHNTVDISQCSSPQHKWQLCHIISLTTSILCMHKYVTVTMAILIPY
jgi:hypothetical protein